jgi:hypothetical protein
MLSSHNKNLFRSFVIHDKDDIIIVRHYRTPAEQTLFPEKLKKMRDILSRAKRLNDSGKNVT